MIQITTDCFWVLRVEGEAAEYVTGTFSEGAMNDIKEVVLVSNYFDNDITASQKLDTIVNDLKTEMPPSITEESTLNPLYVPSTREQIELMMEGEPEAEALAFVGMDGSPYTLKMIDVSLDERKIIKGTVQCQPFDLPSFKEIVKNQAKVRLN